MGKIKTFFTGLALATAMAFGGAPAIKAQNQEKSKIIFTDYDYDRPDSAQTRLWIVNPDGTELKKLTDSVEYNSYYPSLNAAAFSPDGSMITYFGTDRKHKVIDLDGKLLHSFIGDSKWSRSDDDFAWTPDSKAILFGAYVQGLYKFDLEKDTIIQIFNTNCYCYDHNPVMSPDMKKIAYTHHEYESIFYEYVLDLDSAKSKLVTSTWSPDTITTKYDRQLDNKWLDNNHILFNISSRRWGDDTKDVIGFYDVDSATGKNFFIDSDDVFRSMTISKDRKKIALVSPYRNLRFVDIESLNSDSLTIIESTINRPLAMSYSSDNNIFCVSDEGLNSNQYPYDEGESGIYAYDKNMNRYIVMQKKDFASDSIGSINFVEWNSKPVNTKDLGAPDLPTSVKQKSLESFVKSYPNPFRKSATVMYDLQSNSDVTFELYNNLGQKVSDMMEKNQIAGQHEIYLDGSNMKPGIYIYRLNAGDKIATGKMVKE